MYFDFIDITKFGIFLNSFYGVVIVFFALIFGITASFSLLKS
jgi:hypothetical protein